MCNHGANNSNNQVLCHVCHREALILVSNYGSLSQVTSDCKPWPADAKLCLCRSCGCVQKIICQEWISSIEEIYSQYSIYCQGDGREQQVFENDSGAALSRSKKILAHAFNHIELSQTGRFLDVGCGNGAMLRSFQCVAPQWHLAGTELSDKYRSEIERIDNTPTLFTCSLPEIPETFNMISMVHVLEHIVDPLGFLVNIRSKLTDDGVLLIEVPDYLYNPFDLVIADHCTHFSRSTLEQLLVRANFDVITITDNWIPKELSAVARKSRAPVKQWDFAADTGCEQSLQMLNKRIDWLHKLAHKARRLFDQGRFGIFGTSIAGTWLYDVVGGADFFVDEDVHRIGHCYMGKQIYHPLDVPENCSIFLAQPPEVAKNICNRLKKLRADLSFCLPNDIERF